MKLKKVSVLNILTFKHAPASDLIDLYICCHSFPQYSRETPGRFKIPDTFMNPNMADMSLSQTVFHCRNPNVLTVTTAGNILVWDITPFLAADQSLHKEIFKIISLQKINITCIATTDR